MTPNDQCANDAREDDAMDESTVEIVQREIEAGAKALYESHFNRPTDLPWEATGNHWRQGHMDDARTVLLAASRVNDG